MGVLSPRNLRWMNDATGDPSASDAVHTFLEALVRLTKDGRLIEPLQRQELPSPEMARKYVNGRPLILFYPFRPQLIYGV